MSLTYPVQAAALYEALRHDPYFAALESWVEQGPARDAMLAYYDFSMLEAKRFGRLYLGGTAAHGVSVWLAPLNREQAEQKRLLREAFLTERFGARVLGRYQAVMAAKLNAERLPVSEI